VDATCTSAMSTRNCGMGAIDTIGVWARPDLQATARGTLTNLKIKLKI